MSRRPRPATLITDWLRFFASQDVRIVRLDAVGYVVKKPGTSCFMVEPEIYDFLGWVTAEAASCGLTVLPEVHDVVRDAPAPVGEHGLWTYDFVLPGLVLHAFETGDATRLAEPSAGSRPTGCSRPSTATTASRSGRTSTGSSNRPRCSASPISSSDAAEMSTGSCPPPTMRAVDVHQLNCTYYSALDCDDDRYLAARAIQLFARGVPQVYYVGLLAGENDRRGRRPQRRRARDQSP